MSYPTPPSKTAHLTCPGCWSNTLAETLAAPGYQLGGVAWFQCLQCNWAGSTDDLREPTDSAQILACMREDQHRGSPGSSSEGNNRKKPVRWVQGESKGSWDTGESSKSQLLQTRSKVIRWGPWVIRVTEQEWVTLLRISGGNYPAGLVHQVERVLGGEAKSAAQTRQAFGLLVLEIFSERG